MKQLSSLIVFSLVVGALAGCGSGGGGSPTAPIVGGSGPIQGTAAERAAVLAAANLHPEFLTDGVYESAALMSTQPPGGAGRFALENAITPITFTRTVRVVARSFEYAFADTDSTGRPTVAVLTVHRTLEGTLNIVAADTTGSFNAPVRISKPIAEEWTRKLEFVRVSGSNGSGNGDGDCDDDDDDLRNGGGGAVEEGNGRGHGRGKGKGKDKDKDGDGGDSGETRPPSGGQWELSAVSAVLVETPEGEADIVSLRFEAAGLDTTISDPLGFISVEDLPILPSGTEVTITATTNADDDIVLLVAPNSRVRLHSTGGSTYSGTFTVPSSRRAQHFGITVLTHDTLYDDTAPYDSESWLAPVVSNPGI